MFSLAKPEIRVIRDENCIEFLPHRYYRSYDVAFCDFEEFVQSQGDRFIINEAGFTREVFNIGEVTYCKPLHTAGVWLDSQSIEDFTGEVSTAYEKMRQNQHDVSTIDHITLTAMTKENPHTTSRKSF